MRSEQGKRHGIKTRYRHVIKTSALTRIKAWETVSISLHFRQEKQEEGSWYRWEIILIFLWNEHLLTSFTKMLSDCLKNQIKQNEQAVYMLKETFLLGCVRDMLQLVNVTRSM